MAEKMAEKSRMRLRIHYPLEKGRITVRTDRDWDTAVEAASAADDLHTWTFDVESDRPYFYYKPCLELNGRVLWSKGNNYLAIAESEQMDVFPYFHASTGGTIGDLMEVGERSGVCSHLARCYYPPGYFENTLQRYPVLYMHDGQNLFFPYEAFLGDDWRVDETMDLLDAMSIIRRCIVVGVYPKQRETEYTEPGYNEYGRFLIEELKQKTIDRKLRTLPGPESTAVMGSSLGGVVSMYLAWQWPEIFGMAACMSSTFTWRDSLMTRIEHEARRPIRVYLDSGWPGDNYEVTRSMRDLLVRKGFEFGRDLMYFAFPEALHSEKYWAMRSHIPFQFFFGEAHQMPDLELLG